MTYVLSGWFLRYIYPFENECDEKRKMVKKELSKLVGPTFSIGPLPHFFIYIFL